MAGPKYYWRGYSMWPKTNKEKQNWYRVYCVRFLELERTTINMKTKLLINTILYLRGLIFYLCAT